MSTKFIVEEVSEELKEEGLLGSIEITKKGIIVRGDTYLLENQDVVKEALEMLEK